MHDTFLDKTEALIRQHRAELALETNTTSRSRHQGIITTLEAVAIYERQHPMPTVLEAADGIREQAPSLSVNGILRLIAQSRGGYLSGREAITALVHLGVFETRPQACDIIYSVLSKSHYFSKVRPGVYRLKEGDSALPPLGLKPSGFRAVIS